ncbi:MAG: hypothetical protein GXO79_10700 [Chlorobi bacterium]|nr:hypothetical protein [Chlorobiota bacterium]
MKSLSIFIILILLLGHNLLKAQEVIKGKPTSYTSDDGKFYIQKNLPVYIYLSNSPDSNSTKYRLRSKKSVQYTNPMYFDTDGFNSVRTKWAVSQKTKRKISPPKEIIYEVYADSKPPETYGIFSKKAIGYKDGKRIYPLNTELSLLNYDAVTGLQFLYYSINNTPYLLYDEPLIFSDSTEVNLKFYGIDKVGNTEHIHTLSFYVQ